MGLVILGSHFPKRLVAGSEFPNSLLRQPMAVAEDDPPFECTARQLKGPDLGIILLCSPNHNSKTPEALYSLQSMQLYQTPSPKNLNPKPSKLTPKHSARHRLGAGRRHFAEKADL